MCREGWVVLLGCLVEGSGEGHGADADIGNPFLVVQIDDDEEVGTAGGDVSGWGVQPDSCGDGAGVESDLLERGEEKAILFEAVAAPFVCDELLLEGGVVEVDGFVLEDVKVLEGDGAGVAVEDGGEGFEGGGEGFGDADAVSVGGEVDRVGHD